MGMILPFRIVFFLFFSFLVIEAAISQNCEFSNVFTTQMHSFGGRNFGVSFADIDNDGDDDFFICTMADEPNQLFENIGDGEFNLITEESKINFVGHTYVAIWGDINNDGFVDLYFSNNDFNDKLYLNNGDQTFVDITQLSGIENIDGRPNSLNMADVNNDGFLDIYVSNFHRENVLYINNGDLTFTDGTFNSRALSIHNSMGAIFFDYDADGDSDLYLTHDLEYVNRMYENDGNGVFDNVARFKGLDYQGECMGIDIGDYDNDGLMDLYFTEFYDNVLLHNMGEGVFENVSSISGIGDEGMGWGTFWFDYDNDGYRDLYVSNDSQFSLYPNVLYRNNGDGTFNKVCASNNVSSWAPSFGAATADVNLDGKLDILISNTGFDGCELFLNENETGNWVKFKLEGTISNRSAVGTRLELTVDGIKYIDEVTAGSSYISQNSLTQHFGLGEATIIDDLKIYWPSGQVDSYSNLEVNKFYHSIENNGIAFYENTRYENAKNYNEEISVYPNPVDQYLTLEFAIDDPSDIIFQVINLNGSIILEYRVTPENIGLNRLDLDLSSLKNGMYSYKLRTHQLTSSGKLLKK
ncbi:MAG: VCBS repeat-containing protein [Reichenbachiella sp.]